MNENSDIDAEEAARAEENQLLSEHYDAFHEALEILYVRGNSSGRIQFLKNWPDAGVYVFGEELIGYDHDGVQDRDRLVELEDAADVRREDLLEIVQGLEERSVDKGALQIEYVEKTVTGLGRDLALLLYAPNIVGRFIATPAPVTDDTVAEESVAVEPPSGTPSEYVPPPVVETQNEAAVEPVSKPVEGGMTFVPAQKPDGEDSQS